ncbi:hypothetical protein Salat_0853500 [Sesamum alatum]|uniref:Uncharacterized protein n=1 Tax=Sesamum alatum TaxID=300844 RepID=A0AAE1YIL4_9LAMI|nr:hypothetical protein Salat_0853500 [Sesamum alatum]
MEDRTTQQQIQGEVGIVTYLVTWSKRETTGWAASPEGWVQSTHRSNPSSLDPTLNVQPGSPQTSPRAHNPRKAAHLHILITRHPQSSNLQPITELGIPTVHNLQPTTHNPQPTPSNPRPISGNPQPCNSYPNPHKPLTNLSIPVTTPTSPLPYKTLPVQSASAGGPPTISSLPVTAHLDPTPIFTSVNEATSVTKSTLLGQPSQPRCKSPIGGRVMESTAGTFPHPDAGRPGKSQKELDTTQM